MKHRVTTLAECLAEIVACTREVNRDLSSYLRYYKNHLRAPQITSDNAWQFREFARYMRRCYKGHDITDFTFIGDHSWGVASRDYEVGSQAYRVALILQETWPRRAEQDPTLVSYFASVEDARRDKLTTGKLGRYLTRFFDWKFDNPQIAEYVNQHIAKHTPPELKFATTADDIQHVYENGPSSCMGYTAAHFAGGVHPARVYAGPDTAVAYLQTVDGRITARVVVIPERKLYTRIYGNETILAQMLEAQGYRQTNDGLDGCRLTPIYYHNADDGKTWLHMPYLDWCARFDHAYGDDYVRVRENGRWVAHGTGGLADNWRHDPRPRVECGCCGGDVLEANTERVYADQVVCNSCQYYHYAETVVDTHGTVARVHSDDRFYVDATETWYHTALNEVDMLALNLRKDSIENEYWPAHLVVQDLHGRWIRACHALRFKDGRYLHHSAVTPGHVYDPTDGKLVDTALIEAPAITLHDLVYNICADALNATHACTRLRSDDNIPRWLRRRLINWVQESIWAEVQNDKECAHGREAAAVANADV